MPMPKELFAKKEIIDSGSESFFLADEDFRKLAENGASVLIGRYELIETFELRLEPKLHPVANK
jgi:hypothetical protein